MVALRLGDSDSLTELLSNELGDSSTLRFQLVGWLGGAILQVADADPLELSGAMEVLSSDLSWNQGQLEGTVIVAMLAGGGLPVLTGGRLIDAVGGEAFAMEQGAAALAAQAPRQAEDKTTKAAAPAAAPSGWAAVAAASESVKAANEEPEEVPPSSLQRGDYLLHPMLGRCRVLGQLSSDAVKVQVSGGRTSRKLMLRVFKIIQVGDGREFELIKRESK